MKISNWELNILKQILKEEKEFNVKNEMQLVKAYLFKKEYLLTKENELFLTLDSIIEVNNIILNKKNQSLRKWQIKPVGFNFEYMHFSKIEQQLQILIDNYNDRMISKKEFLNLFLSIHPFLDGNGRTVKILMI